MSLDTQIVAEFLTETLGITVTPSVWDKIVRNLKKNVEALHINNLQHGVKTWLKPACCNKTNTIKKKFQTSVLHRYISYM